MEVFDGCNTLQCFPPESTAGPQAIPTTTYLGHQQCQPSEPFVSENV